MLRFTVLILASVAVFVAHAHGAWADNFQIDLTIEQGRAEGGQVGYDTTVGSMIVIRVRTDRSAVILLENFDIGLQVGPLEPAEMIVDASRPGRFALVLRQYDDKRFDGEPLLFINVFPN